jgi:Domain of unknown function (DUF397)
LRYGWTPRLHGNPATRSAGLVAEGDGVGETRDEHGTFSWRRARACAPSTCVEVAAEGGQVFVRNSKHPDAPALSFTTSEFRTFLQGAKDGDFDDLV